MIVTTDWKTPTRVAQDDSVGTTAWVETESIFDYDGYYQAFSFFNVGAEWAYLSNASLVFNDAIDTAHNEATGTDTTPFANLGGASDLWGRSSITGSEVSSEKFGVAIAIGTENGGVYSGAESYYLIATGFGFDIPDSAVITGVEVDIVEQFNSTGGGTQTLQIDTILLRLTYTWDIEINAEASSFGGIFVDPPNRELPRKKYRFKAYSDGTYLGDWKDVSSDPTYKQEINNLIGSMPISFARNDLSLESAVDTLLNEDNSVLTNEDDSPFLIDITSVTALGEGTNLDTNYDVVVDAIYGQFEPLLNEDDTPILNEDGSMILVEDGFPLGRPIFRGYIPRWELPLSGKGITSDIRSYSQDLKHLILETQDTAYITNSTLNGSTVGISGGGPTDREVIYQTFTMAAQKTVSKIRLYPNAGWYTDVPFTIRIYAGNPTAVGTLYAIGTGTVNRDNPVEYYDVVFESPATLPAGTYFFEATTDYAKTGGNETYPFNLALSSAYAGGSYYEVNNYAGLVNDTSKDIAFILYEAGLDTTVPFNSYDPSNILKAIIDFARSRGAEINYTSDSIELTGTTVSYTFRAQTVEEAIKKVLELAPANWYFYYDFGTDTLYFKEKSATPDRWLRKGQTVVDGKIVKTIEQIVNDVLFTGGGNPALYVRRQNTTSISAIRRGLRKISDNRVTTTATANILADGEIDQYDEALYAGDVEITEDGTFYLEDVAVGEVYGFIGFGRLVDAIVVQGVSKDYRPDSAPIALTYNVPRVNKRVEDIKRNLDTLETTNNPVEPS